MRSRGWAGHWPASDEEAITRILDAADAIVAEPGSALRIADVARALGVTRQTVYRYFPHPEAIRLASAMRAADGFLDQLADHVGGMTDPVAVMVECVAYAVERLAGNPQFETLLAAGRDGGPSVSLTSDTALALTRTMLHRFDIDWQQHGFDATTLDELGELTLRTMHSILVDPGEPARRGPELRRFVARWLGPVILYPRLTQAVVAITAPGAGSAARS